MSLTAGEVAALIRERANDAAHAEYGWHVVPATGIESIRWKDRSYLDLRKNITRAVEALLPARWQSEFTRTFPLYDRGLRDRLRMAYVWLRYTDPCLPDCGVAAAGHTDPHIIAYWWEDGAHIASMNPQVSHGLADLLQVWEDYNLMDSSGSLPSEKAAIRRILAAYPKDV